MKRGSVCPAPAEVVCTECGDFKTCHPDAYRYRSEHNLPLPPIPRNHHA